MTEKLGLALPTIGQIGIVVKDIKKAIEYYSDVFGIGPFTTFEFSPEKHWFKGKPMPIKLNIAIAQMGSVMLELIEPVEGDAPHKWFLEEKGEGLHHLGFIVDNYDKWLHHLKENGIDVLMNDETEVEGMGNVRAAYIESNHTGGVLFELIEITPK